MPVPADADADADSPKAQCMAGRMGYTPREVALVWTIKQFSLRAHFGLPSVESDDNDARRPIVHNLRSDSSQYQDSECKASK